jgi:transposase
MRSAISVGAPRVTRVDRAALGTLLNFRTRLLKADLDRRLVERTVALAASPAAGRQLRAALDSSPLWGAGRVEETYNVMGHALRKALGVIARQQGWGWPREPWCWPPRPEPVCWAHRA